MTRGMGQKSCLIPAPPLALRTCKDSICNDPELILGSYVKGLNNKICRAWTEKLGLGHRTVVGHGVRDGRTEVN